MDLIFGHRVAKGVFGAFLNNDFILHHFVNFL